ncbi:MAG TPA: tripartite tricarboxylate transporter substrate-binding protein [Beijerinckiaceae bacterium]|nr:tripartite tricarboxylate transporter substrate-binding protein [Beijerinckiaceae bacterium]
MNRRSCIRLSCAVFSIVAVVLTSRVGIAQEVNFAGKRITVFVGFSPGGIGYDTYARELAHYLGKYLPGNPSVVVENRPGAGSMTLANYIYNVAPHDGTEIALIGRGVATDPLIMGSASAARFDAPKFNWLGSMNNEVSGLYLRDGAPAKNLADLLSGTPVQAGGTGPGGDQQVFSQALNTMLHMNLHVIPGYPGTNEILLAMAKGELDALAGYSWAAAKVGSAEELHSGKIKIVLQLALRKHPDLPDVPVVTDLVKTEDDRQALELIMSRQSMGRPVVAPPGLKPEMGKALRQAISQVMKDPQFIAECDKVGLEVNYVGGEEVQALVERLYRLSPSVVLSARHAAGVTAP